MFCEGVLPEINNPGKCYITLYSGVGNLLRCETVSSKIIVLVQAVEQYYLKYTQWGLGIDQA